MLYEDLHRRFGAHIAKRVQFELSAEEFKQVVLEHICEYLDQRAEAAHKEYQLRHDNPFLNEELGAARSEHMNALYQRWRDAEDLAYLVSVADSVGHATRLMMVGTKG